MSIKDCEIKGDMGYFINLMISHVMSNVIYSVHKIIYHSNFMGKLPSLVDEAKQSLGDSSFSNYIYTFNILYRDVINVSSCG